MAYSHMFRAPETRYRKTKIRAIMIQDEDYLDTNIKVLKFVETNETDDFTKQKASTSQDLENKEKPQAKENDSPSNQ